MKIANEALKLPTFNVNHYNKNVLAINLKLHKQNLLIKEDFHTKSLCETNYSHDL